MFNFIKEKLQKIYSSITTELNAIFNKPTIDQATIDQLYQLLIQADTGVATTKKLIQKIQDDFQTGKLTSGKDLQQFIEHELLTFLQTATTPKADDNTVYLLVGINGSGKTTLSGKLAYYFHQKNKTVILAAADTFRAAAPQQLEQWAQRTNAQIIMGKPEQDPASVTFDACQAFKKQDNAVLIVDTAGRLQNKENLMKELAKTKRIITAQLPNHKICTILTIDAMLGQNSFMQAKLFHEATQLDGIALTKMDGTAKGGIVFSIVQELHIPVIFLSWGEDLQDLMPFEPQLYVKNLLGQTQFQPHKNTH